MNQRVKSTAIRVSAVALVGAAVAVVPAAAQAASYNGVCGSSYGVIDAMSVPGYGTIYLTYSSSTGDNCVVTIRNTPGAKLPMLADISLSSSPTWTGHDSGNYTTYAGPVYVHAPGSCIDWGGGINGDDYFQFNSHCS